MYSWMEWYEIADQTIDISYESTADGYIPLECNGVLPNGKRCRTKVKDGSRVRINGVTVGRRVHCTLCDHDEVRKVGKEK